MNHLVKQSNKINKLCESKDCYELIELADQVLDIESLSKYEAISEGFEIGYTFRQTAQDKEIFVYTDNYTLFFFIGSEDEICNKLEQT